MKLHELFEQTDEYTALVNLLKKNCKKNLKALIDGTAIELYRGTAQPSVQAGDLYYLFSKTRTTQRASATGFNLFLDFTRLSDKWENVPNRALSSSATPSFETANQFSGTGATYLIIPADNVSSYAIAHDDFNKIGVGPNDTSPFELGMILSGLSEKINKVAEMIGISYFGISKSELAKISLLNTDNYSFSISDIKLISSIIEKAKNNASKSSRKGMYTIAFSEFNTMVNDMPLWDFINNEISPNNMGIKVVDTFQKIKPLIKPQSVDAEVWFKGGYVGISYGGDDIRTKNLAKTDFFIRLANKVLNT